MADSTSEIVSLTEEQHDDLIRALFEPDDDCAHNMLPLYAVVERIVAARLAQMTMIAAVNGGLHRDAERELVESERRHPCPTDGCHGDGRYAPPGKGHKQGCDWPRNPPVVHADGSEATA